MRLQARCTFPSGFMVYPWGGFIELAAGYIRRVTAGTCLDRYPGLSLLRFCCLCFFLSLTAEFVVFLLQATRRL